MYAPEATEVFQGVLAGCAGVGLSAHAANSWPRPSPSATEPSRLERPLDLLPELSSAPAGAWRPLVLDEDRRCFAFLWPRAVTRARSDRFFAELLESAPWVELRNAKGTSVTRSTCWHVRGGCKCDYTYGKDTRIEGSPSPRASGSTSPASSPAEGSPLGKRAREFENGTASVSAGGGGSSPSGHAAGGRGAGSADVEEPGGAGGGSDGTSDAEGMAREDSKPERFSRVMREITEHVFRDLFPGLEEEAWPNCANVNLYRDGRQGVGWHADDESLFRGKDRDCPIVSLSLGTPREFWIALKREHDVDGTENLELDRETVVEADVSSGDLLTMEGRLQRFCAHLVPKGNPREPIRDERINITFRWVREHRHSCPQRRPPRGEERLPLSLRGILGELPSGRSGADNDDGTEGRRRRLQRLPPTFPPYVRCWSREVVAGVLADPEQMEWRLCDGCKHICYEEGRLCCEGRGAWACHWFCRKCWAKWEPDSVPELPLLGPLADAEEQLREMQRQMHRAMQGGCCGAIWPPDAVGPAPWWPAGDGSGGVAPMLGDCVAASADFGLMSPYDDPWLAEYAAQGGAGIGDAAQQMASAMYGYAPWGTPTKEAAPLLSTPGGPPTPSAGQSPCIAAAAVLKEEAPVCETVAALFAATEHLALPSMPGSDRGARPTPQPSSAPLADATRTGFACGEFTGLQLWGVGTPPGTAPPAMSEATSASARAADAAASAERLPPPFGAPPPPPPPTPPPAPPGASAATEGLSAAALPLRPRREVPPLPTTPPPAPADLPPPPPGLPPSPAPSAALLRATPSAEARKLSPTPRASGHDEADTSYIETSGESVEDADGARPGSESDLAVAGDEHVLSCGWTLWLLMERVSVPWEQAQQSMHGPIRTAEAYWQLVRHTHPASALHDADYSLFREGLRPAREHPALRAGGRWLLSVSAAPLAAVASAGAEAPASTGAGGDRSVPRDAVSEAVFDAIIDDAWTAITLALIGDHFCVAPSAGGALDRIACGAVISIRERTASSSTAHAAAELAAGARGAGAGRSAAEPRGRSAKMALWLRSADDMEEVAAVGRLLRDVLEEALPSDASHVPRGGWRLAFEDFRLRSVRLRL